MIYSRPVSIRMDFESSKRTPRAIGCRKPASAGCWICQLQRGSSRNRTALAIYYGYYHGHSLFDRLQLDLFSWRHALTPDFGYPETADSYDLRRPGFLSHTVAHNTMMGNSRFSIGTEELSEARVSCNSSKGQPVRVPSPIRIPR